MPEWLNVAEDDTVDLISGGTRGRRRGDYIALDVLDEEGTGPRPARASILDRRAIHKTVAIPFAIAFVVIIFFGYAVGSKPKSWAPISNGTHSFFPTTMVISLDGMHPHYISPERTPYMDYLVHNGAAAPYMIPSFPTQTFPNHWTLVTGLYPANHGIVGNNFFDRKLGEFHHYDYESRSEEFFGGEPIWKTAKRQDRITAVHMWPGSDFIDTADYLDKFNQTEPLKSKVDRIFEWIDLPIDNRPQLIMSYVPDVDSRGHADGIAGQPLLDTLTEVDNFIANIHAEIKRRSLEEIVNLIIVSDHGMAPTSDERVLYIDDYLDMDLVERRTAWPNYGIRLKDEVLNKEVKLKLSRSIPKEQAVVFSSDEFPEPWHFSNDMSYGFRIAPLYVVPQIGWNIVTHDDYNGTYSLNGVHGYAPENPLMRSLFMAVGPKINVGKYDPFPNVNLYPLLCGLLQIQPAKNDGVAKFSPFNATAYKEDYPGVPYEIEFLDNSTFSAF